MRGSYSTPAASRLSPSTIGIRARRHQDLVGFDLALLRVFANRTRLPPASDLARFNPDAFENFDPSRDSESLRMRTASGILLRHYRGRHFEQS